MKLFNVKSLILLTLIFAGSVATALASPTADEIAGRVYDRPDGNDRTMNYIITLTNQRGSTRVREISMVTKDFGHDSKSIVLFTKPADVKDTMYLSWNYEKPDQESDRWLYMPAIKNVRRVSSSTKNDYFMGTDFTYDDLSKRSPLKDTHELLAEEVLQERKCWKLKSVPRNTDEGYTHRILWVDQETYLCMRCEYYDKDGLFKFLNVDRFANIDGFWTVLGQTMNNVSRSHTTSFVVRDVKYDTGVKDSLFNVSTLQKGRI